MQQILNLNGDPNNRDSLVEVGFKVNQNFSECYAALDVLKGIVQENAPTASKLYQAQPIMLTGEARGTVLFDGSGPASLAVEVVAHSNSIADALVRRDVNGGIGVSACSTTAVTTQSAGVSERYRTDDAYTVGTVVVFGGAAEITTTDLVADPRVAGVITLDPAITMNAARGADDTFPRVTILGRTPCKVLGPIHKGDLLVTAATPGYAQAQFEPNSGTVIGKALQDFTGRQGLIDISVTVF